MASRSLRISSMAQRARIRIEPRPRASAARAACLPMMRPPVGKSGPGTISVKRFQIDRRIVDIGQAGIDHFAQIMGRDVGGHAHGDAGRTIDQHIGKARRQHHRLSFAAIVIVLELDRVLVDVFGQRMRDLGAARFGVTHGRGRIAVHRAEIALPVDQGHAHGEILRHAHQGVIDRLVAMGMILAHHVAHDQGRFAIGLVPVAAILVHRIENAAMHGLQTVARIRQRAAHDHAHGVIEIGFFQLVLDRDRRDWRPCFGGARRGRFGVWTCRSKESSEAGLERGKIRREFLAFLRLRGQ